MANCRKCGAEFKESRTGSTVNCPDCRRSPRTTGPSMAETRMLEAKVLGYAARRSGDKAAEKRATEDYIYWRGVVARSVS